MDFNYYDSCYLFISRETTTVAGGLARVNRASGCEGVTIWN